ncbi:hypothetical protein D3C87_231120 [compost metagenome]
MVLLHEFRHTKAVGGFSDPPLGSSRTGPVVDRENIYRKELDNNPTTSRSGQFGKRKQYYAEPAGSRSSIDFQYQTINKKGKSVTKNTTLTF